MADYIVANDCLFGYPIGKNDGRYITFVVMAVDVPKGGDPLLIDRTTIVDKNNARKAEDADFERFKIRKSSNMTKITESQLNKIVAESIKSALNEWSVESDMFRRASDCTGFESFPHWHTAKREEEDFKKEIEAMKRKKKEMEAVKENNEGSVKLNEYGYDAEVFRNWADNDELDKFPQWKKWDKQQEKERRQKMKRNARRAMAENVVLDESDIRKMVVESLKNMMKESETFPDVLAKWNEEDRKKKIEAYNNLLNAIWEVEDLFEVQDESGHPLDQAYEILYNWGNQEGFNAE